MSTPYPKQSKAFAQWAKLMQEQATVPDRVQYKSARGSSSTQTRKPRRGRRRRPKFRRKRRSIKKMRS